MRNIRFCKKWHILAYICGVGMLFACTEYVLHGNGSESSDKWSKNKELTVSVAKQWYVDHYDPVVTTRSGLHNLRELMMRPMWSGAKEYNGGRYESVEIPILTKGYHIIVDAETAQKWKPEDRVNYIRNVAKFVILYDKKKKSTRSFVMIFVGSYDYLYNKRTIGKNSYFYREPDFDGSVLFYELNGSLINGWKYAKGKIIATISPSMEGNGLYNQEQSATTRALIPNCFEECYTRFYQECSQDEGSVGYDEEFGGDIPIINAHCTTIPYEDCNVVCDWIDDGSGDRGDDNPPGGAGNPPIKPGKDKKDLDPCSKSAELSKDAALRTQVDKFYDNNWTDKRENGWIKTQSGDYIYPKDGNRDSGSMNYTSSQVAGQSFEQLYHCHPASTGQSCIPSPRDLEVLAHYYLSGHISASDFSYGVISEIGCLSIIISNESQFSVFAEKIYNGNGVWDESIKAFWETDVTKVIAGTIEASIGKLLNFFNDSKAGLSVMFRPMSREEKQGNSYGSDWQAKEIDKDGHYNDKNCN